MGHRSAENGLVGRWADASRLYLSLPSPNPLPKGEGVKQYALFDGGISKYAEIPTNMPQTNIQFYLFNQIARHYWHSSLSLKTCSVTRLSCVSAALVQAG